MSDESERLAGQRANASSSKPSVPTHHSSRITHHSPVQALDAALLVDIYGHARRITAEAGQLLLGRQAGPRTIEYKDKLKRDPVTDADKAAEAHLRQAIQDRFPDHAILGEEGDDKETGAGDLLWALDPLDGTANYATGLPIFAVSVAVLHAGVPVVGCIAVPAMGALYHARLGGGAFESETRLRAHGGTAVQPSVPVGLFAGWRWAFVPHRRLRHRQGEPRALGSIAAEIGLVAGGALQYAVYAGPRLWDVAAGVLLVTEAGGAARFWRREHGWQPLDRFAATDATRGLRAWSAPTLLGGAALVPLVAADLTPRRSLAAWRVLKRLARGKSPRVGSQEPGSAAAGEREGA
jgi:myo-inositol-1(or 4)-monophosphatase